MNKQDGFLQSPLLKVDTATILEKPEGKRLQGEKFSSADLGIWSHLTGKYYFYCDSSILAWEKTFQKPGGALL